MEKITFNIQIKAPKEKLWKVLWEDESYQNWTAVFSEGSKAETDWQEGSRVLFLDGKGNGMISKIAKNIPFEFMSIEHLGFYENGKEDFESPGVKSWAGALENYTIRPQGDYLDLKIEMDITDEYKEYFESTWPKALEKVKQLAET